MDKSKAEFELFGLQAKAIQLDELEFVTFFTNAGLPQEIITRVQVLFDEVKEIAGQVIHIGKIILMKLVDFIKENPNMAIGMAIGVGLGILVNLIPFIGSFIAPVVTVVGMTIGGLRGHRLDKIQNGEHVGDSMIEDMITIAKKFWKLFSEIFSTLKEYFVEKNYV